MPEPDPEPETTRTFKVWGREVSQIPCFRNSFLYGISSGLGLGFVTFMSTSRPALSAHVMMSSFTGITLAYWFTCRYQFSKTKFEMHQMQRAIRERALMEGTEREQSFLAQAKEA